MTLQYAANGRGMINSCAAACHNNKANVWGYGFKGSAGLNPSIAGTNVSNWTNPFDLRLATKLKAYFGDGGIWWNTGGNSPPAPRVAGATGSAGNGPGKLK